MYRTNPSRGGSSVIDALLVLFIAAVIGFVGYSVHTGNSKNVAMSEAEAASNDSRPVAQQSSNSSKVSPTASSNTKTSASKSTVSVSPANNSTASKPKAAADSKLQASLANADPNDTTSNQDLSDAASSLTNF